MVNGETGGAHGPGDTEGGNIREESIALKAVPNGKIKSSFDSDRIRSGERSAGAPTATCEGACAPRIKIKIKIRIKSGMQGPGMVAPKDAQASWGWLGVEGRGVHGVYQLPLIM